MCLPKEPSNIARKFQKWLIIKFISKLPNIDTTEYSYSLVRTLLCVCVGGGGGGGEGGGGR